MTAGYAAMQTNLNIKAKGNIKQKTITSETLKQSTVESGDGLYKDTYEEGRFFYRGANPNNYITFNNEMWRILSIEADGTIKIIKNGSVGNMELNNDCKYNWETSYVNNYLNNNYLTTITLENQNYIVDGIHSIGLVQVNNELENNDLTSQIASENSKLWPGKIGLMAVSEFIRTNSDIINCGNFNLNNQNSNLCSNTTWIQNILTENQITEVWFITYAGDNGGSSFVYYIDGQIIKTGPANVTGRNCRDTINNSYNILPTLYLSSDITLTGKGTKEEPYHTKN